MSAQVEEIVLLPTEDGKQRRNEKQIFLSLQNSPNEQHPHILTR
jgi:hypothetical protein